MGLHGSWEYSIQRYGPVGCILHGADHLGQMGRSQCRPLEDQSLLPRNLSNPLPVSLCPLVLCSHIFSITLFFLVFFFFLVKTLLFLFLPFALTCGVARVLLLTATGHLRQWTFVDWHLRPLTQAEQRQASPMPPIPLLISLLSYIWLKQG